MARYVVLAAALASLGLVNADGIYGAKSPVLQVNAKNYDSLIAQSNHTSIVEFYAPWCGHCQNLKPAYEKAAKSLTGLAKVAAVNCDEESNKPFCGQFGVQGFPTLKIVRPGKKAGRPSVEDYQGPRSAKGIVEAVSDKIPNHVKKLQDSNIDSWLDGSAKPKAILFTEKGTTSAMIKALAIDFLGSIDFAQVRNKETATVERYDVDSYPTVVLIQNGEPIKYEGEVKKESLVAFFSQAAAPNPDPAPKKSKASSTKKSKNASSASSAFSKASKAHKSSDYEDYLEHASTVILGDNMPTESPLPIVDYEEKPMVVEDVLQPIPILNTPTELEAACLQPKSGYCLLALLPQTSGADAQVNEAASEALVSLAEIAARVHKQKGSIFPFYAVPADNSDSQVIRQALDLKPNTEVELLVTNMKRGQWVHYNADTFDKSSVDSFVDAIKFGEGSKQKLPADFFATTDAEEQTNEPEAEPLGDTAAEHIHDEL